MAAAASNNENGDSEGHRNEKTMTKEEKSPFKSER